MFKKNLKVSVHNPLNSKDRKKLKKSLYRAFDSKIVDRVFIDSGELSCTKLTNKILIYSSEECPLFVDSTGKKDFFPTVYALDLYPDLCKSIYINPDVEQLIVKGKHLKWSGVTDIDEIEDILPDDVVAIRKSEGSQIVAVGAFGGELEEAKANDEPEGIGAYVLHWEGDKLWEAGPKEHLESKFNKEEEMMEEMDFSKKKKKKKRKKKRDSSEDEDDDDNLMGMMSMITSNKSNNAGIQQGKGKANKIKFVNERGGGGKKGKRGKKGKKGKKNNYDFEDNDKDYDLKLDGDQIEEFEPQKESKNKRKGKKKKKNKNNQAKVDPAVMRKMDEALMEAFLNAVKLSLDPKDLPIETSKFWKEHMLPCKNMEEGEELDFKLSTYKKIGKFMQKLKKEELIEYAEASKKDPQPKITKIEFTTDKINDWRTTIDAPFKEDTDNGQKKGKKVDWVVKVKIEALLKPMENIYPLLENYKAEQLLTDKEAQKKFADFLRVNKLIEGNLVRINEQLENCLGYRLYAIEVEERDDDDDDDKEDDTEEDMAEHKHKTRNENSKKFRKVNKKELVDVVIGCMDRCHRITDLKEHDKSKQVQIQDGEFQKAVVIAEKSKNRFITRVKGLEVFNIDMEQLSAYFSNQFSCSCAVHEEKGGSKDKKKELILQGTFLDEVMDMLRNECKIDESLIEEINKQKNKKKEKTMFK